MSRYEVQVAPLADLGIAFPNAKHFEWRILDEHGRPIARSIVTYPSAKEAAAAAQRVVGRLAPGSRDVA
jgi:hypothetical protein